MNLKKHNVYVKLYTVLQVSHFRTCESYMVNRAVLLYRITMKKLNGGFADDLD